MDGWMDGWIKVALTQQSRTFPFSSLKTEKHPPSISKLHFLPGLGIMRNQKECKAVFNDRAEQLSPGLGTCV